MDVFVASVILFVGQQGRFYKTDSMSENIPFS